MLFISEAKLTLNILNMKANQYVVTCLFQFFLECSALRFPDALLGHQAILRRSAFSFCRVDVNSQSVDCFLQLVYTLPVPLHLQRPSKMLEPCYAPEIPGRSFAKALCPRITFRMKTEHYIIKINNHRSRR